MLTLLTAQWYPPYIQQHKTNPESRLGHPPVECDTPRELNDGEEDMVNKFRFGADTTIG